MALRTEVLPAAAALEPLREPWDALAAEAGRPFCRAGWMLAAWAEARTGRTELRVVVVRDDAGDVVAIAPWFLQLGPLGLVDLRLLAAGTSHRLGVLCRPGREAEAAGPLAQAIAAMRPRVHAVVWEGVDAQDPFPDLVAARLPAPAGTTTHLDLHLPAPVAELPDVAPEAWVGTRSRNARSELRRARKRFDAAGGTLRQATLATLDADLAAFDRLHRSRWEHRGGSTALDDGRLAMVRRAATELIPVGGLRLWMADLDGAPIGAALVLAAGDAMTYWGGGMDDAHQELKPGQLTIIAAIEDGLGRGERSMDLGGGDSHYKRRLADADRPVVWRTTFPRGARYPLTRAQLAPKHLRQAARERVRALPPERQEALKRLVRRYRPS